MSPLSSVFISTSDNLGGLISYFRVHMPPIFVDCPLPNGVALLLFGITLVGYGGFGESLCSGEGLKVLILYVIASMIALNSSFIFVIFSLESFLLNFIFYLLASISDCMMMNC